MFFFILKFPPNRTTVATGAFERAWIELSAGNRTATAHIHCLCLSVPSWWELPSVSEFPSPLFSWIGVKDSTYVGRCSQARPFWSLGEELFIPAVVAELILCVRRLGGHKRQAKAKGTWDEIFRNTEQEALYLNVYETMQGLNPEVQWVTSRLVCFWSGWAFLGLLLVERTKRINGWWVWAITHSA